MPVASFFISYNQADKAWAEWIAWTLEESGHNVVIRAWDFRPGSNLVLDLQRAAAEAERTIMVLSEAYLNAMYTQPEWAAAFKQDPTSTKRQLLPIRVAPCEPSGMLATLVYVDLVGLEVDAARQAILEALPDRLKPETEPPFPENVKVSLTRKGKPNFPPSAPSNLWKNYQVLIHIFIILLLSVAGIILGSIAGSLSWNIVFSSEEYIRDIVLATDPSANISLGPKTSAMTSLCLLFFFMYEVRRKGIFKSYIELFTLAISVSLLISISTQNFLYLIAIPIMSVLLVSLTCGALILASLGRSLIRINYRKIDLLDFLGRIWLLITCVFFSYFFRHQDLSNDSLFIISLKSPTLKYLTTKIIFGLFASIFASYISSILSNKKLILERRYPDKFTAIYDWAEVIHTKLTQN